MADRRDFIGYLGTGAIGSIVGYYVGAQKLLGIQPQETSKEPESPSEPESTPESEQTPEPEPTPEQTAGYVKYDFEDSNLDSWNKRGHDSQNEMGIANVGHESQHSLYLDHNGSINNFFVEISLDDLVSPRTLSFWIQPTREDQYTKDMFRLRSGETDVIWFTNHRENDGVYLRFREGNNEEDRERIRDGAIPTGINRFVEVRLEQINWANGNIGEVYIDNTQVATDAPFVNTQPGFDTVAPYSVGFGNSAFRIDDIGWE
jgi:hypothetical protein